MRLLVSLAGAKKKKEYDCELVLYTSVGSVIVHTAVDPHFTTKLPVDHGNNVTLILYVFPDTNVKFFVQLLLVASAVMLNDVVPVHVLHFVHAVISATFSSYQRWLIRL